MINADPFNTKHLKVFFCNSKQVDYYYCYYSYFHFFSFNCNYLAFRFYEDKKSTGTTRTYKMCSVSSMALQLKYSARSSKERCILWIPYDEFHWLPQFMLSWRFLQTRIYQEFIGWKFCYPEISSRQGDLLLSFLTILWYIFSYLIQNYCSTEWV